MVQAVIQTTVTGLQGNPVSATVPAANQSLTWTGSAWAPAGPFQVAAGGPFLPVAGGTITGGLTVNGALTATASPTTLGNITSTGSLSAAGNITCAGFSATNVTATTALYPPGGSVMTNPGTGGWIWRPSQGNYVFLHSPTADPVFQFSGGVGLCWIYSNGNMSIGGTLGQGSDQTNKTNINLITEGVSLVRQLLPKSFAWNTTPSVLQWGFIAQDVETVIPTAVSQMPSMEAGGAATLSLDITGILAAVTFAVKQIDERMTAAESHAGITPPAAQLA